jgi:hypothetical protein
MINREPISFLASAAPLETIIFYRDVLGLSSTKTHRSLWYSLITDTCFGFKSCRTIRQSATRCMAGK